MKKLLILLIPILLSSCFTDDEGTTTQSFNVKYCPEDNLIKVNDGQWISSIDYGTLEPANQFFGVRLDFNDSRVYINSNNYSILEANETNLESFTTIEDEEAIIYIPELQEWLFNNSGFRFEIIVE